MHVAYIGVGIENLAVRARKMKNSDKKHGQKLFLCPHDNCNVLFDQDSAPEHFIQVHLHTDTLPFRCLHCPKKQPNFKNWNMHMMMSKKLFCVSCDQMFHRIGDLREHAKKEHSKPKVKNSSPDVCDRCGIRFVSESRLKRHIKQCKISKGSKTVATSTTTATTSKLIYR